MILHYAYWNEYFGYKFSITREALINLPQWSKREAFPPLSPRIAIANSRSVVRDLLEEVRPFDPRFSSCALKSGSGYEGSSWYYIVSWHVPDLEDVAADWSEFSVPVLFDGSIPAATKFKYEDRFDVYGISSQPDA